MFARGYARSGSPFREPKISAFAFVCSPLLTFVNRTSPEINPSLGSRTPSDESQKVLLNYCDKFGRGGGGPELLRLVGQTTRIGFKISPRLERRKEWSNNGKCCTRAVPEEQGDENLKFGECKMWWIFLVAKFLTSFPRKNGLKICHRKLHQILHCKNRNLSPGTNCGSILS